MTVEEEEEGNEQDCLRPRRRTDGHERRERGEGVGTHAGVEEEWRCRHVRSRGHGSRPGGGDGQVRIWLGGGEERERERGEVEERGSEE